MTIAKDLLYAQQVLVTLFSVTNKLQMQGDKYLQDITIRQMLAIPAIIHAPEGKATINYIARKLGTTKQSAKQIVDAMEKKGYLTVGPSEVDRRAVNVSVTAAGRMAFGTCSERTDEFLADIFHEFNTDELEQFCKLLQKLYRFDGIVQEEAEEALNHDESQADIILQYHQSFVKRRVNHHPKEE